MMRGGGAARRLATILACSVLAVLFVASTAGALGRSQGRWPRSSARQGTSRPQATSLKSVLQHIWQAKRDKAAKALADKALAKKKRAAARARSRKSAEVISVPRTPERSGTLAGTDESATEIETLVRRARQGTVSGSAPVQVTTSSRPPTAENPLPARDHVAEEAVHMAANSTVDSGGRSDGGGSASTETPGPARQENPSMSRRHRRGSAKNTLRVLTGKSLIIDLAKDAKRVSVANPEVAEVMIISPRQVMANGLEDGETSIIIWDNSGNYAMYNLVVGDALEDQVMLEVTIAEVNRTELERHGMDIRVFGGQFRGVGQYGGVAPLAGDSTHPAQQGDPPFAVGLGSGITWGVLDAKNDIAALFKQLQEHNLGKVLAEPKLLARSGQAANFLSGGEVPIVITQDLNTTIEFKEFGTKVDFLPTVREDGSIDLMVKSEVSEPDFSKGIQLFGFTVPGFITQRVSTRVTLGDGESLIVAGLMKEKKREVESKMPFVGDIPLLGYLFRRTEYSKDVFELVIVVKPRLVGPIDRTERVKLPTDRGPLTPDEVRTKREDEKVSRPRPF